MLYGHDARPGRFMAIQQSFVIISMYMFMANHVHAMLRTSRGINNIRSDIMGYGECRRMATEGKHGPLLMRTAPGQFRKESLCFVRNSVKLYRNIGELEARAKVNMFNTAGYIQVKMMMTPSQLRLANVFTIPTVSPPVAGSSASLCFRAVA